MTGVETLIEQARFHFERGAVHHAGLFYRRVLAQTEQIRTPVERIARGEAAVYNARFAIARYRIGEAGDWYKIALEADPAASEYRSEFVRRVLLPLGMFNAAIAEAKRAVDFEPENPRAHMVLGIANFEAERIDEARVSLRRAVDLPNDDPAYFALQLARVELNAPDYDAVRELVTPYANVNGDAVHYLAMCAFREGKFEDAIELYERSISMETNSSPAETRFNMALALHSLGRYPEGFRAYDARGETMSVFATAMKRFKKPIWRGEPAPCSIHMHEEMGHGDTLALCRYARYLSENGYDVRLEVRDEMIDLMRRSFPSVSIVSKSPDYPGAFGIKDFDYHLPTLSAPASIGTTTTNIPYPSGYLVPDPVKIAEWRKRLPDGPKIGVCWAAGKRDGVWLREYARRKSVSFDDLTRALLRYPGMLVSLQLGPEADDNDGSALRVLDASSTWDDTAAVVSCLDAVVSVDTALAHLVGALGKPLHLLMHSEGSWHWMTAQAGFATHSPWYDSARLHRQHASDDWSAPLTAVGNIFR